MSELLRSSWSRLVVAFGATLERSGTREALVARYSEPWRTYHTVQHLEECLSWFEASCHLAEHPAETEAALWFHDAVYDPRRLDNEEQSARLAESTLVALGAQSQQAGRVAALVLATKHTAVPQDLDEQLLVDIDLSILGADPRRFAEYEEQVRAEYSFVPETTFWEKRRTILRSFLARPRLFGTEFFHGKLERRARENLARSAGANAA